MNYFQLLCLGFIISIIVFLVGIYSSIIFLSAFLSIVGYFFTFIFGFMLAEVIIDWLMKFKADSELKAHIKWFTENGGVS